MRATISFETDVGEVEGTMAVLSLFGRAQPSCCC